jgi:ABC-type phosphate transport system permease subunit
VPNGANIFTASLILTIMILPYMAAVFRELFLTVPPQVREAAYGLGCTPFEVVRAVIVPYVRKGLAGVIMLGLGRALGETMAVTFIIGNAHGFPDSLFASGSTIASTIAHEFTEATGEMHTAALIALGLVLFLITFAVLAIARLLLGAEPGSWQDRLFAGVPNGANIFTASLILAIMILPYMAAVFRELFLTVPPQLREAAYGLGCTPFEVVRAVIVPYVRKGMAGVVMLGLGRALGETMAVTFIIGNAHGLPDSLFASGSTIASTIANEFTEATGEMHTAALIALGLVLFLITFAVLAIARLLLGRQTA